jgi:hypothetical protein
VAVRTHKEPIILPVASTGPDAVSDAANLTAAFRSCVIHEQCDESSVTLM